MSDENVPEKTSHEATNILQSRPKLNTNAMIPTASCRQPSSTSSFQTTVRYAVATTRNTLASKLANTAAPWPWVSPAEIFRDSTCWKARASVSARAASASPLPRESMAGRVPFLYRDLARRARSR